MPVQNPDYKSIPQSNMTGGIRTNPSTFLRGSKLGQQANHSNSNSRRQTSQSPTPFSYSEHKKRVDMVKAIDRTTIKDRDQT